MGSMVTTTAGTALTPYLAVDDARAAIRWYADVLDAGLEGEPIVMPDGRIGHAELAVAGARLYLSDAHPEIGVVAPTGKGTAVTCISRSTTSTGWWRRSGTTVVASSDRPMTRRTVGLPW